MCTVRSQSPDGFLTCRMREADGRRRRAAWVPDDGSGREVRHGMTMNTLWFLYTVALFAIALISCSLSLAVWMGAGLPGERVGLHPVRDGALPHLLRRVRAQQVRVPAELRPAAHAPLGERAAVRAVHRCAVDLDAHAASQGPRVEERRDPHRPLRGRSVHPRPQGGHVEHAAAVGLLDRARPDGDRFPGIRAVVLPPYRIGGGAARPRALQTVLPGGVRAGCVHRARGHLHDLDLPPARGRRLRDAVPLAHV